MPDDLTPPAKPGTACLGCRRRKLKCSREPVGCANCTKADLPCVYPAPEVGVKRKRGPYKKDKPARERHLEDLVKYLEPKSGDRAAVAGAVREGRGGTDGAAASHSVSATPENGSHHSAGHASASRLDAQSRSGNAEDLVKDALIALTKSSVHDIQSDIDPGRQATGGARQTVSIDAGQPGSHPSARRMFEYWDLFVRRVDPLLKIIHCPSFAQNLFLAIDRPQQLSMPVETLLFSVYFAAVSTCTAKESRERFGESKTALLERYGKTIEGQLADNYAVPALEALQALVLYLVSLRRSDGDLNFRALFSLAVRMAQMVGLPEDPAEQYSPFERELRRRLWWQICHLESRAAEEGVARQTSIMDGRNVRIPSNVNDMDLEPHMKEAPAPRSGIAETTFLVLRYEIVTLAHRLWAIKKRFKSEGRIEDVAAVQQEQRAALDHFQSKVKRDILPFCDPSRRYDDLLILFYEAMSIKMHMIVNHPTTKIPTPEMSAPARLDLLHSSVVLIGATLGIENSDALRDWAWYFRGYMQWHAVGVVIAELGRSTNPAFANNAWAVLDPVLRSWDASYALKRDEPAWDHVNGLIERARGMRRDLLGPGRKGGGAASHGDVSTTSRLLPALTAWSVHDTRGFTPPTQPQQPAAAIPAMANHLPPGNGCGLAIPAPDAPFDMDNFASLEDIDFSAFDAVFGDTTWDSSPGLEVSWDAGTGTWGTMTGQ